MGLCGPAAPVHSESVSRAGRLGVAQVLGKFIGVVGTTALVTAVSSLGIPGGIRPRELLPVGMPAGI